MNTYIANIVVYIEEAEDHIDAALQASQALGDAKFVEMVIHGKDGVERVILKRKDDVINQDGEGLS